MKYIILILSIIISIRTGSYGVYEIKKNSNILRWYYRNTNCYYIFAISKYYNLLSRAINYIIFKMPNTTHRIKNTTPSIIVHFFSFPSLVLPLFFS